VKSSSFRTQYFRKEDVKHEWIVINAENKVVGRLCSQIAHILRGKHKPVYTPNVDCGDYVIVLNADKVRFTGNKWKQKEYIRYSGYPGGQKKQRAEIIRDSRPEKLIEFAVRGMLPKNRLGRKMFKKLFVYSGSDHPHNAQQPRELNI
jgi:large subunit ribosomal protein L13